MSLNAFVDQDGVVHADPDCPYVTTFITASVRFDSMTGGLTYCAGCVLLAFIAYRARGPKTLPLVVVEK